MLDANGNRIGYLYDFKITGDGLFTVEFQSASSSPVIPDGQFILVVQRRPDISNLSRILAAGELYTFPSGAAIQVNQDFTITPIRSNGTAQEQQGIFVSNPKTKAKPTGFIALLSDGSFLGFPDNSYVKYSLSEDGVIINLPPTLSSLAEYSSF